MKPLPFLYLSNGLKWAFEGRLVGQDQEATPAAAEKLATISRSASTEPSARR